MVSKDLGGLRLLGSCWEAGPHVCLKSNFVLPEVVNDDDDDEEDDVDEDDEDDDDEWGTSRDWGRRRRKRVKNVSLNRTSFTIWAYARQK